MDTIESFDDLEYVSGGEGSAPTIKLKDGIDMKELLDTSVATFEINLADEDEKEEEKGLYFNKEELLQFVNFDSLDTGAEDSPSGATPFEVIALKMFNITEDGKVKKQIIKSGSGPIVPEDGYVFVNYNAYVEYGDEPFDSTWLQGHPRHFRLKSSVIPGLDTAISSMKKGELAKFLIHPDLAFRGGCPPRIPKNAEILFEVELLNYVDDAAAAKFEALSTGERKRADFKTIIDVVDSIRLTCVDLCKRNHYNAAVKKYKKGINILENYHLQDEEEEKIQQERLLRFYANLAICYNKLFQPQRACTMCKQALAIDNKNVKALFNFGRALIMLSEYKQAKRKLLLAKDLEPGSHMITEELKKLERKQEAYEASSIEFSKRIFKSTGSETSKAEEKSTVSPAFEEVVKAILEEFAQDNDKSQMPLPGGLTAVEELFLRQKAEELGLVIRCPEKKRLIYVCKPESSS